MYVYVVWVLLLYLHEVSPCPEECTCSLDYEYEDGVMVDCENLALQEIPFNMPSHVSTLLLNYNSLQSLEGLQYYNNLRALELQNNNIADLDPAVLQKLAYLKILVVSENEISEIPARLFRGLLHLEWVDLRGNQINHISKDAFYRANNINYLNLMDNELTELTDGALQPLTSHNLWLLLGSNSLKELPGDITTMKGLHHLSVSHNYIRNIPPQSLLSNKNLRALDISFNKLAYLHEGTFKGISLQQLGVEGNRWQCDCYMEWLREYLLIRQTEHVLTCAGPRDLQSQSLAAHKQPLLCNTPVVTAPDPEVKVLEYKNITIECLVTGDTDPEVTWFKDNIPLEAQGNRYSSVVGPRHKLVFRSVLYTDSGIYTCSAGTGLDSNDTIILSVLYAPKIVNSYKWSPTGGSDNDAMIDVTLACDVVSNPPLNGPITWFKESSELYGSEEGIKISRTGQGSVLYLSNTPNADNSGQYKCLATNSLGLTVEHFQVTQNDILMLRSSAPAARRTAGTYHHHIQPVLLVLLCLLVT